MTLALWLWNQNSSAWLSVLWCALIMLKAKLYLLLLHSVCNDNKVLPKSLAAFRKRKRYEKSCIKYFASKRSSLAIVCWEQWPHFWNFHYVAFLHPRRFLVQCLWLWYFPLHMFSGIYFKSCLLSFCTVSVSLMSLHTVYCYTLRK